MSFVIDEPDLGFRVSMLLQPGTPLRTSPYIKCLDVFRSHNVKNELVERSGHGPVHVLSKLQHLIDLSQKFDSQLARVRGQSKMFAKTSPSAVKIVLESVRQAAIVVQVWKGRF